MTTLHPCSSLIEACYRGQGNSSHGLGPGWATLFSLSHSVQTSYFLILPVRIGKDWKDNSIPGWVSVNLVLILRWHLVETMSHISNIHNTLVGGNHFLVKKEGRWPQLSSIFHQNIPPWMSVTIPVHSTTGKMSREFLYHNLFKQCYPNLGKGIDFIIWSKGCFLILAGCKLTTESLSLNASVSQMLRWQVSPIVLNRKWCCVCWGKFSRSTGWPETCYVAEANIEPVILLLSPARDWDHMCEPPCSARGSVNSALKLRVFGKDSTRRKLMTQRVFWLSWN